MPVALLARHGRHCPTRSSLADDDAHAGDPFRHQVVVAQLGLQIAHLPARRPPRRPRCAPRARRSPRRGRSPHRSCASKSSSLAADEALRENRGPIARSAAGTALADDEVARGAGSRGSRARRVPPGSACGALDQAPRHVRRAHFEPRRRRIVRQAARADDGDAHVLARREIRRSPRRKRARAGTTAAGRRRNS